MQTPQERLKQAVRDLLEEYHAADYTLARSIRVILAQVMEIAENFR